MSILNDRRASLFSIHLTIYLIASQNNFPSALFVRLGQLKIQRDTISYCPTIKKKKASAEKECKVRLKFELRMRLGLIYYRLFRWRNVTDDNVTVASSEKCYILHDDDRIQR